MAVEHAFWAEVCGVMLQEYFEHVRKDPAYLAVEKNVSGSRPKELFEDCIEQVPA